MAYDKATRDRNKANADKRVVDGNLVHKDSLPKSKGKKLYEKMRSKKTQG